MLRRLSVIIICLLIISLAVPSKAEISNQEEIRADYFTQTERLIKYSGAVVKEIKLSYWGQISNKLENLAFMEEKFLEIAGKLGLDDSGKALQIDRDGSISISLMTTLSGDKIQLYIQAIPAKDGEGITSWGISVLTADNESAGRYNHLLRQLGPEWGQMAGPEVEFCGIITRSLTSKARMQYLEQLADFSGAQLIEGIDSENLTSMSLYHKSSRGGIDVQGQRINLNLALRSNYTEDKTYVYIGMPLIFADY